MRDHPLKNSALYSALNRALEGPAAYWLTQIMNGDELTWQNFKEQFAAHFGGQEVAAASLIKVAEELPRDGETPGAYGNRIITLLGSKWRNSTREEVLAATALHLLGSRDERFKRLALTSDITSVKQFQREMKPFLYTEWPTPPPWRSLASSGNKRGRSPAPWTRCGHCGIYGHPTFECRKRAKWKPKKDPRRPEESRPAAPPKALCFHCHMPGHIASRCPSRREEKHCPEDERRVDACVVEAPTGRLSQQATHEDV